MIGNTIIDCIGHTPLVRLDRLFPQPVATVYAKLELLNPGGSVKDRPARFIIEHGLKSGVLVPGVTSLVESTSGNFGIALAMVCRIAGISFTAVVDPCITQMNLSLLRWHGAKIELVHERDDSGGYLKTRLRKVAELVADTPNAVWVNQYANELAWQSHFEDTGRELVRDVPEPIDTLVIAVSTSGTIRGVSAAVRETFPQVKVVAVDAVGSVIFGQPPAPRKIPGIGASRVPELLRLNEIDKVVHVDDAEAISGCHELLRYEGILAGGSSGAVVAAIARLIAADEPLGRVLTILPDRGERYLDLIYPSMGPVDAHEAANTVRSAR